MARRKAFIKRVEGSAADFWQRKQEIEERILSQKKPRDEKHTWNTNISHDDLKERRRIAHEEQILDDLSGSNE